MEDGHHHESGREEFGVSDAGFGEGPDALGEDVGEDEEEEQGGEDGRADGLEGDAPEAQGFLAEQPGESGHGRNGRGGGHFKIVA